MSDGRFSSDFWKIRQPGTLVLLRTTVVTIQVIAFLYLIFSILFYSFFFGLHSRGTWGKEVLSPADVRNSDGSHRCSVG